jgi:hypothetical protein
MVIPPFMRDMEMESSDTDSDDEDVVMETNTATAEEEAFIRSISKKEKDQRKKMVID